ncbi:MAG: methyl-accepting chemotaxis protein [bacterium]|nr:methyl-accepting chemotaxis protein [bacterium]
MKRLTIKQKLLLLILLPLFGLIYLAFVQVSHQWENRQAAQSMTASSQLAAHLGQLMHQFQKERGMTAGFLGSKGVAFKDQLPPQRKAADQALTALLESQPALKGRLPDSVNQALTQLTQRFQDRAKLRNRVDAQSVAASEAIAFYTDNNRQSLELVLSLAANAQDPSLSAPFYALFAVQGVKEKSGIERAVLANVFARGSFGPDQRRRLIDLIGSQQVLIELYLSLAEPALAEKFRGMLKNPVSTKVNQLREEAFSERFLSSSTDWFNAATARIDDLAELEKGIIVRLGERAQEQADQAGTSVALTSTFTLALLLLVAVLAWVLGRSILQPIHQMLGLLKEIAEGEGDLTKRLKADGRDEVAQLSRYFNLFVSNIQGILQQIDQSANTLASSISELSAASEQMAQSSREIAGQLDESAQEIGKTQSLAQEIHQDNQRSGESIADINQKADQALDKAAEGTEALNRTNDSMDQIEQSSRKIEGIIRVITEISTQTNLLSLNAAIEAAKAGEFGKGFAVVADEVRNLADRSNQSVTQIQGLIERGVTNIEEGKAVITKTTVTVQDIIDHVRHTANALSEIGAALSDQTRRVDLISRSADSLAAQGEQNARAAEQLSQSTTEVAKTVHELDRVAEALAGHVAKFKI